MECPKCHKFIEESLTVCPHCKKVLALKCPNCGTIGESAICSKCGYTILVKCSKCSKMNLYEKTNCTKCGFPIVTSLAYQECESDEFAAIVLKFNSLKKIKSLLKSQELYSKFLYKLKNLLYAQIKSVDCKIIVYGDEYIINFNKELSLPTSSNKAVRLALKIINTFAELNINIIEELGTPLNLTINIIKKDAERLQEYINFESNVKLLTVKKGTKKYLRGLQLILDQFVWETINKNYKTDSLYTLEENGQQLMFYEVILDSYILPPSQKEKENEVIAPKKEIQKEKTFEDNDKFSFKTFDIEAKCKFEKIEATSLIENLNTIDFEKGGKIISIKYNNALLTPMNEIIDYFKNIEINVLKINCNSLSNNKPWGFFIEIFREYYNLPFSFREDSIKVEASNTNIFKPLFDLLSGNVIKAMTPEDARFTYMEYWNKFLSILSKTVIIVEGSENLDDTSIQTLQLYFDNFKSVKPNFLFINNDDFSIHTKFKNLLRTNSYIEYKITKSSIDNCLSTLKSDATDFIQSFYFEKIKENFKGSYFYFKNALEYLLESGILIDFENKLIVKNKKTIVLPTDYKSLLKARLKNLSKDTDISLILAYTTFLGGRIDITTLERLGVKEAIKNCKKLESLGILAIKSEAITLNNSQEISPIILSSLKKDAEIFLVKNILALGTKTLDDTSLALMMNKLSAYKEEYLTLWKNAQFAIKVGDYDAYLKNCLSYLSLVEKIETNIPKEDIDANKKEVYNNILMFLYAYSPEKIYFIENILLMDAINENDNEKIIKLSNLMLQGALITSNYSDAIGLLHNILSRMQNPTLLVDGSINTKFLLLSLVNVEILYNIGDFRQCVDLVKNILTVLNPDVIEKIKPANFSTNLFVNHILETCRLASLAKLYMLDNDLEDFINLIETTLATDFPEKSCILALKNFLANKVYSTGNIEDASPYSKIIFLILQEISTLEKDYNKFAQNIYQAKLLAIDVHQKELELLCDLLIGYAYSRAGVNKKALYIYDDVLNLSEKFAMFNLIMFSKYLKACLLINESKREDAMLLINDSLAYIKKYNNQASILFVLFENLYINIVKDGNLVPCDIEIEIMKLEPYKESLKRIIK